MGRAYCECVCRYTHAAVLRAVAGGSRASALASDYGCAPASVDSLLGRKDICAVIIATPETVHPGHTMMAAAAGKHVLVEKPMARDVATCTLMIDACTATGVKLMPVKHWRFRGVHTRARSMLRAGSVGSVCHIRNRTRVPLSASLATVTQKPFYLDPRGGGLLMGWAVHNLDWVRVLADSEVEYVRLRGIRRHPTLGASSFDSEIRFVNGVTSEVCVEIDLPEPPGPGETFRTEIETEHGRLDLDGYGSLRVQRDTHWETMWTQPPFDPRDPADPKRLEAYAAMVQAFIDCVRYDTPPVITGHDGMAAVAMFAATKARDAAER